MVSSPEPVPNDVAALRAMLIAAWAERDAERAEKAQLAAECDQLASQNDRLRHLIRQRLRFGRRSEKLDPDQLNLALEDVEQAVAEIEAQQEKADPAFKRARAETRRAGHGSLPEHLPRVEVVIEPENTACRCCGSAMQVIGEDRSSRLDVIPAQYRVLITRRPKYACRTCQEGVVQAAAPARLIAGGLPTERLVAQVLVAKYADHCPLYRQAQILARQGIVIDRSTLAFWVGYAAAEIKPLWRLMRQELLRSTKLFVDETTAPVLDPGRGRTKTGYFWVLARDDRPWCGRAPPAVVYSYAPGPVRVRAVVLGLPGLAAAVHLGVLAVASLWYREEPARERQAMRFLVLIPAHDEEQVIGRALGAIMAERRVADTVLVVADRCSDGTA